MRLQAQLSDIKEKYMSALEETQLLTVRWRDTTSIKTSLTITETTDGAEDCSRKR